MNVQAARMTTRILAATCGALLLLLIVQYAGLGRGYRWDAPTGGDDQARELPSMDARTPQLPAPGTYVAIEAHPLFNEDREPTPADALAGDDNAEPPASPLNVQLTGVIIDEVNQVRVAMLLDKTRNQPVSLRVGMPLEGDQAAWTLVELKPRVAVFRNAAAETSEVELETASAAPAGPGRAAPRSNAPRAPASAPQVKSDVAADDLAKRIEERRRQMREEAERNRRPPASPTPDKK